MTVAARNTSPAPRPFVCAALTGLALLAGCGGGSDASGPASSSPSPFSSTPAPVEEAPAAVRDPDVAPAPEPVPPPGPTSADAGDPAARYTSLEATDCRVLQVDRETGASTSACAGVAGYRLQVLDADARMSVDVVTPEGRRHPLALPSLIGAGGFSSLGPRAEWRLGPDDGRPQALIVRYLVQESEQAQRNTSYLVVARISGGKVCAVARIAPGPGQNEQARRLADGVARKPCLEAGGAFAGA